MTRKTLDRSFNRNTGQGLLISALDVQGRFRYSFRRKWRLGHIASIITTTAEHRARGGLGSQLSVALLGPLAR